MDFVRAIALLAHPVLASALIFWIWRQYSWRKTSKGMKGQIRKDALEKHEKNGQFILWAGIAVVLVAFIGRMVAGWRSSGDIFAEIWPTSLHGTIGPLGLALLLIMTNLGKSVKRKRLAGENGIDPFLGSWLSSLILTPLAILLTYRATNDIGSFNLEVINIPFQKLMKRLFPTQN